ncbi:hypothetical protein [Streptomyces sp. S1]|uniref:hypothetical protein n=1 Tax=Streptomyces sp. S1 TaxID=718288 RepID=UPI003D7433A7
MTGLLVPNLSLEYEWEGLPPWVVFRFGSYDFRVHPYRSVKFEVRSGEASVIGIVYRTSPEARHLRVDLTLDGVNTLSYGRGIPL